MQLIREAHIRKTKIISKSKYPPVCQQKYKNTKKDKNRSEEKNSDNRGFLCSNET